MNDELLRWNNEWSSSLMKNYDRLALFLLAIAGILWGVVALFTFDLVPYLARPHWLIILLYFLFGVAAVYTFFNWKSIKKALRK
jgi:uncharacterized membrane protein YuzA (DUF378 family)